MWVNPKNLKVSGFPSPRRARLSTAWRPNSIRRVFSELSDSENSCNRSRITSQKRRGVSLVLKPNDDVVGIAHNDHVTRGLAPSPAFGPEVEGVMQVDVGEQRW